MPQSRSELASCGMSHEPSSKNCAEKKVNSNYIKRWFDIFCNQDPSTLRRRELHCWLFARSVILMSRSCRGRLWGFLLYLFAQWFTFVYIFRFIVILFCACGRNGPSAICIGDQLSVRVLGGPHTHNAVATPSQLFRQLPSPAGGDEVPPHSASAGVQPVRRVAQRPLQRHHRTHDYSTYKSRTALPMKKEKIIKLYTSLLIMFGRTSLKSS